MYKEKLKKFIFLSHKADAKFQAFGKTLEELFENAASATISLFLNSKIKVKKLFKKKIKVQGKDLESLLYNFLEEFLFLLDSEQFLTCEIKNIIISKPKDKSKKYLLEAEIYGDDAEKYSFVGNVKAVTYNQMFVKKDKDGFVCQVVLDM